MFHLNVSLLLRDKDELKRFLDLVNNTPGVKSGNNPPDFFSWDSCKFAWVKLESQFLNATNLSKVLQKDGYAADVYDAEEFEPREVMS